MASSSEKTNKARDILNIAARARLSVLDASGLFGRAETLLGDLIPRPVPFRVCLATARADRGPDYVEAEARAALRRIGVERADSIVVHSPSELFGAHGAALWDRLLRLKDQGLFAKIGIAAHATDDPVGVASLRHRGDEEGGGAALDLAGQGVVCPVPLRHHHLRGKYKKDKS